MYCCIRLRFGSLLNAPHLAEMCRRGKATYDSYHAQQRGVQLSEPSG